MAWTKREPTSNLVVLGDDEGQVKKVGGLLLSMRQDAQYPSRQNYEIVQRNGDCIWLAGSASLGRQLFPGDVGKFVKCEFTGWGKSANGKFKMIDVNVYDGEPTEDMKKWPHFGEAAKRGDDEPERERPEDQDEFAAGGDGDLPF
jgi:hypothetical protein